MASHLVSRAQVEEGFFLFQANAVNKVDSERDRATPSRGEDEGGGD
jgi:hypothetical protein